MAYKIPVNYYSFFELDLDGNPVMVDGMPRRKEGNYTIWKNIQPKNTAIFVIDPWDDSPSQHMNHVNGKIIDEKIVPLLNVAAQRGHPIYILTNDPKELEYSVSLHPSIKKITQHKNVTLIYHRYTDYNFLSTLKRTGIKSIIYVGFHSNGCILTRPAGMVTAVNVGFEVYFVPEASRAVERPDTRENEDVHKMVSEMVISFSMGGLIHLDDLIGALEDG